MNVLMRIKRFDPDKDNKPYWDEFRVEMDPIDRLLDALNTVKWTMDGTLVVRARTAYAARMPCVSTGATAWPAKC